MTTTAQRVKVYRRCRCTRKHRTFRTWAVCAYPRAAWVVGEGEFALIAWCSTTTISLWPTLEGAHEALAGLGACGGRCVRRHEVVRIVKG